MYHQLSKPVNLSTLNQTKKKILRDVCLSQSEDKRDAFHILNMKKTPVKIKNFIIDEDQGLTSVRMQNNAIVEKSGELDFEPVHIEAP